MTKEPSACTRGFDICLDGYSKLREKIAARLRGAATDLSLIGRAVSGAFRFLQRRQIWHIILRDTGAKASVLEIGWLHSCLASLLLLLNQNRARGTKPTKTPKPISVISAVAHVPNNAVNLSRTLCTAPWLEKNDFP